MTTTLDVGQHIPIIRFQFGINSHSVVFCDLELRRSQLILSKTIYTLVSMPRFTTTKRFTFLVELTTGRILPDLMWPLVHGHLLGLSTLVEMVMVQSLIGNTL